MLKKEYRLPARSRLRNPRTFRERDFAVKIAPNQLSENRFAFVVRKAVDNRAVIRNQIRRSFRACIEELLSSIRPGQDMLFFLEKGIIDKSHEVLLGELKEFFSKNGITK